MNRFLLSLSLLGNLILILRADTTVTHFNFISKFFMIPKLRILHVLWPVSDAHTEADSLGGRALRSIRFFQLLFFQGKRKELLRRSASLTTRAVHPIGV